MQILVATLAVLIIFAFAATKLQFRKGGAPKGLTDPAATVEQQANSFESIKRLETELLVADFLYSKSQMVAMDKAATFMGTMARKIERRTTEAEYHVAKDKQRESQLELMIASDKARVLYFALKKLDPDNETLLRIRDAGRVKGGISPYDD